MFNTHFHQTIMSQTAINLVAVSIFLMTLSTLLGPLFHFSSTIPAIGTLAVLGIATLDAFSLQGKGGTLVLDWVAGFSPEHRERIVHHEAGHFLVAYLLGVPVTNYALNAWEALKKGLPGQGGVVFGDSELENQLSKGSITAQMLDRYCTIWMAGIAAETLAFNNAEGGADDKTILTAILTNLGFSENLREQKRRFCSLQAKTLIQDNWEAYQALVNAMRKRASVIECQTAIAESKK